MPPCYADGTSQTEKNGAGDDDKFSSPGNQQRISKIRATLVEVRILGLISAAGVD